MSVKQTNPYVSYKSKWYTGQGNPEKMAVKTDHIHVLPLGFPRLAVMQAGREWKGGTVSAVGPELGEDA